MQKFTVWRSGSGHLNCWNTLPVYCGEYDAENFIDACKVVAACLDQECFTSYIVDGIMYIESTTSNKNRQKLGRYGFFQTQDAAMTETMKHFSTPQTLTDSLGNTILVDVRLLPNKVEVQYLL